MEYNEVQLLVYGKNISQAEVSAPKGIEILKIHSTSNPNYLFIDIEITPGIQAGNYKFQFTRETKKPLEINYELRERNPISKGKQGFNSADAIYLLMPDRFSNGNPANDTIEGMLQATDRSNPDGRHGGDITGIVNHLDYIVELGFTTLWINPLVENNNYKESYHGYAITDFYNIDPRMGSNEDYLNLVKSSHNKGLKVIMDMVFNHSSTNHWFIRDLPMEDWIHQWEDTTKSNFRGETTNDPYAPDSDVRLTVEGWFDDHMADLNQKNPYLLNYLIQNSIWWIEYAGIDGIRMDTYPYPDKWAMAEWAKTIKDLYPSLTILGEVWQQTVPHTAIWQDSTCNKDGYRSWVPSVTDFSTYYALKDGLMEEEDWTHGFRRLYYVLTQDFLYSNANMLTIFPDNHDLDRFYTSIGEDINRYKIGIAYILTTRGIPQIYYGTEILMTGDKATSHGHIRKDFPGGWEGDLTNAFTGEGLTGKQGEAQEYMSKLLHWRNNTPAITQGKLSHFIPENDIYVYFRYTDSQTIMVILSKNDEEVVLNTERFAAYLKGCKKAINVITDEVLTDLGMISIPAMSALVYEMKY